MRLKTTFAAHVLQVNDRARGKLWRPLADWPQLRSLDKAVFANSWEKNGYLGVSGRVCLYVTCYDFMLGFNVSSLPLMFYVLYVLEIFCP